MAKQPETVFKERVLKTLQALPNTWACKIQQRAKRGTPDILACINGHFVAIELKRDEKQKLSPLQEWTGEQIAEANGTMFLAYPENWDAIFNYLKGIAGFGVLEMPH